MRITMVAGHCCIRVTKMALPLIARGHDVRCIAQKVPSNFEQYKTFCLTPDLDSMGEAIKALDPLTDVWHAHNEPSWFVTLLKELSDKPVVLDLHDSYLARTTQEEATKSLEAGNLHVRVVAEERNNFQLADALVYVSDAFKEAVQPEFDLKQPSIVLPSYVPLRFYQYALREWLGGLVYEGKIDLPSETKGNWNGFQYSDYSDVAKRCHEIGMDFHLYTVRQDKKYLGIYEDIAFTHKPLAYDDLLPCVGRHDWGLVGNTYQTREWNVAAPNKLFEYLAAGVPVVAMNADWCASFIQAHDVGIVCEGPEELSERWPEHREKRKNVAKERRNFTMEEHIGDLEGLYRSLQ